LLAERSFQGAQRPAGAAARIANLGLRCLQAILDADAFGADRAFEPTDR
jgi:hypothetical protein